VARPPKLQPSAAPAHRCSTATTGEGEWGMGLIGAREVVERWRNCAKGGGGGALGVGLLRAWREGKEGQGRSGEERGCRGTLL
jgi:hypothetical protein